MRLVLVRHGRTPSNVHRLLDTAYPGAGLDASGLQQAQALVDRLAGVAVDAVYASPLTRTQQTAAPLAASRGLQVEVLDGLREIAAGDQELWPLWGAYVGMLGEWAEGDLTARRPGGESGEQFFARFDDAVAHATGSGRGTVVLVSHGAAIRMWVGGRVGGVSLDDVAHRPLGNTAVLTLEGDPATGWTLVDWEPGVEMDAAGPDHLPGRFPLSAAEASEAAPGWRVLLGRLHLATEWPAPADALEFVTQVAALADALDHHPEVDLRRRRVQLSIRSHDVGALTHRDTAFAWQVARLVDQRGGTVVPSRLSRVEVAIDTTDADALRPFWAAVLGYEERPAELHDPDAIGPSVWFQHLDEPREGRNRIHLDVTVAHDAAEERIARALAAGGRLVSDAHAPAWWVLADADGNEACVSTWLGRDG